MASSQINDGKPSETQSEGPGQIKTLVVGAAMRDGTSHAPDCFRVDRFLVLKVKLAAYSAHTCSLSLFNPNTDFQTADISEGGEAATRIFLTTDYADYTDYLDREGARIEN